MHSNADKTDAAQSNKPNNRGDGEAARALIRNTRLDAIQRLSSRMAHDLRNSLGVIRNSAYLLRRQAARNQIDEDLARMIDEEVRVADGIITNLLELARCGDPQRSEVELGEVIEELTRQFDSSARVSWSLEITPRPFRASCDPGQLRKLLSHLIQNSIDALQGEGTIGIKALRDGAFDRIEVCDSGPGVSSEIRSELFEPLVTTKRTGFGMGLWLCRQIAEKHGGTAELVQEAKGGATFRVSIARES